MAKAEFLLSDDPALGYWKIYAEQKHSGSEVVRVIYLVSTSAMLINVKEEETVIESYYSVLCKVPLV